MRSLTVWWHGRNRMDRLLVQGFGPLDGYGIQIEGFEHHQMMNMMNYISLLHDLVENYGFIKEVDFVSSYIDPQHLEVPESCKLLV